MELPSASNLRPQRKTVFVDSDAFVALARADDVHHARALSFLRTLSTLPLQLVTSNYVFAESVTVISQRIDHQAALAFIHELKSSHSLFTIQWITEEIEALAVRIFAEQTSKNVSFVDCMNMALVECNKIEYIFSFDAIYKKSGYQLVQDLVEQ